MKIKINFEKKEVIEKLQSLKKEIQEINRKAISLAAIELIRDCTPKIPLLTGRLRDSGRSEEFKSDLMYYSEKLLWDAANPKNGYIYAEKQYSKILNHVDGRYAAKWVEITLEKNKGKYLNIIKNSYKSSINEILR